MTHGQKRLALSMLEMALFPMFGALMFITKYAMEPIPNIHPLALFIAAFTIVYGFRALIPLYIYVAINGVIAGFSMWWIPYLYIWLPLWGGIMLAARWAERRELPVKAQVPLYMAICALHGLAFGTLYAPAQMLLFRLPFRALPAWIASGFTFDVVHAAGNLAFGLLVVPLAGLLKKLHGAKAKGKL